MQRLAARHDQFRGACVPGRRPESLLHWVSVASLPSAPWRASPTCNESANTPTCQRKGTLPPQLCGSERGNRPTGPSVGTCILTLPTGPTRVGSACSAAHCLHALCPEVPIEVPIKSCLHKGGVLAHGVSTPAARPWVLRDVEADSLVPAAPTAAACSACEASRCPSTEQ